MSDSGFHCIDGRWTEGHGPELTATDPATGQIYWRGREATPPEVEQAVEAAQRADETWAATPVEDRISVAERFAELLRAHRAELSAAISTDTGKPNWEARTEVDAMIGKVGLSVQALRERRSARSFDLGGSQGATRYKPLGALLVFGPFNFPGHVANGHIVPALLAGNTVIFKPSELTPTMPTRTAALWHEAGLPAGALNLLHGAAETGKALVAHPGHDGVLFTGSYATGKAIAHALAGRPEKMLALEMGGNNPLVVDAVEDETAAAYLTIQSAYLTSGQRCTCARRLIVPAGEANDRFVQRLIEMTRTIRVAAPDAEPQPFMGPVIHERSAASVLQEQTDLLEAGASVLVEARRRPDGPAYLSPGLLDVTNVPDRRDEEVFGPLLQVIRATSFDDALIEANNTRYGLSAALLSDDAERYEQFFRRVRAGLVNWNRQTTGASSRLPFGGVGRSGNHRPSGYFAADYCSDPVASLEKPRPELPDEPAPGVGL